MRGEKYKVSLNVRLKNKFSHILYMCKIIWPYFFIHITNTLNDRVLFLERNHFFIK